MSLSTGYELGRPSRVCASTGRPLGAGEAYIAALLDQGPGQPPKRADYSLEAWRAPEGRPVSDETLVGFWRTTVGAAHEKAKPLLDDESMDDLFAQTDGVSDPADKRAALRFVLALLMIRRRLLAHEGTKGRTMLLRRRGEPRGEAGAGLIEVIDPQLDESTIADVIAELEGNPGEGQP